MGGYGMGKNRLYFSFAFSAIEVPAFLISSLVLLSERTAVGAPLNTGTLLRGVLSIAIDIAHRRAERTEKAYLPPAWPDHRTSRPPPRSARPNRRHADRISDRVPELDLLVRAITNHGAR